MLENWSTTPSTIFYTSIILISELCSLLFIYTIITKSTREIRIYRFFLLKLAICGLLFNMSISMLVSPDLLCPLSAAAIRSPLGSVSENHAFFSVAVTVCLAVTLFLSINDCCFLRVCIFYQWNSLIQRILSWNGVCFFFLLNIVVAAALVGCLLLVTGTSQDFLDYVKDANLSSALGSYAEQTDTMYFFVDVSDSAIGLLPSTCVAFLLFFHLLSLLVSGSVWGEIGVRKQSMSFKSYRSHRSLTQFVLFQNVCPTAAVIVPIFFVSFSLIMQYDSDAFAGVVKHFITVFVAIYPTISVFSSFLLIDPYRKFLVKLACGSVCKTRRKCSSKVFVLGIPRLRSISQESSSCSFDSV